MSEQGIEKVRNKEDCRATFINDKNIIQLMGNPGENEFLNWKKSKNKTQILKHQDSIMLMEI